jgi:hypothetical protein
MLVVNVPVMPVQLGGVVRNALAFLVIVQIVNVIMSQIILTFLLESNASLKLNFYL